jgi:hypothetical protein
MDIITRKADHRGRIVLPDDFANQVIIVERVDEYELRLRKARTVPKRKKSLAQLLKGITKENIHAAIDSGPAVGGEEL